MPKMKDTLLSALRLRAKQSRGVVGSLARGLATLFVPSQWAHNTISDLMNATTPAQRDILTSVFVKSTLDTLGTIGLIVSLNDPSSR